MNLALYPEFYDATENLVAIVQEHSLRELFRDARAESKSIATLIGSLGVSLSTILTLSSAETFKERFDVSASSWQAIFTIVVFLSIAIAFWQLIAIIVLLRRKKIRSKDIVESNFFSEDKKLGRRNRFWTQSGEK